ncbi:hypothetical protein FACS189475_03410 [Betaproteobacteria bacterium]|nr:hypothetical protein FACS189475_03410 [Betaproteobacteria bacterium]
MYIGFIGLGEAGYFMSKGLTKEGIPAIKAFDVALTMEGKYKQTILDRAGDAGITLVSSMEELAGNTSIIFCAVQAQYAQDVAASALPAIKPGSVYVDVTTAKPAQKEALAEKFRVKGISYVDGAMMGSLPVDAHKVPMLCSGEGAEDICSTMNKYGMKMTFVPGKAGMASIQKLVRSSFMKGTEALAVETLLIAKKMGVEKETLQSLATSMAQSSFDETLIRLARADTIHAERRAHEIEDCAEFMLENSITPIMAKATVERLRRSATMRLKEELGGVTPKTIEEVYALWDAKQYC